MPAVDNLKEHVEREDIIRIVTHNDADGVAAGGLLTQLALRLGASIKTTCEKRIDEILQTTASLLKTGGYVPFCDHSIPPEIPWEFFKYYREQLNILIDRNLAV